MVALARILPNQIVQMFVEQTLPSLSATFIYSDGRPVDLSSASPTSFTLLIRDAISNRLRTGQGTWAITDAPNGAATYAWATADTAFAGRFLVSAKVTLIQNGVSGTLRLRPILVSIAP